MDSRLTWRQRNPEKVKASAQKYNKKYYAKDPEKEKARAKRWQDENPEKVKKQRKNRLFRQHGITAEDFNRMLDAQAGLCNICCEPMRPGKYTHIDHDAATGEVRGLLCHLCNPAIGYLRHATEFLRNAEEYLVLHFLRVRL